MENNKIKLEIINNNKIVIKNNTCYIVYDDNEIYKFHKKSSNTYYAEYYCGNDNYIFACSYKNNNSYALKAFDLTNKKVINNDKLIHELYEEFKHTKKKILSNI